MSLFSLEVGRGVNIRIGSSRFACNCQWVPTSFLSRTTPFPYQKCNNLNYTNLEVQSDKLKLLKWSNIDFIKNFSYFIIFRYSIGEVNSVAREIILPL